MEPQRPYDTNAAYRKLVALVGAACCATLLQVVPQFEGTVLRGYKDPIGIVTACTGNTHDAVFGRVYTPAECETLLVKDLVEHAEHVDVCTRLSTLTAGQRAAAVSFTFNVGGAAFCHSTFARKLNAGDPTACAELIRWTKAGGRELPGLVARRKVERSICESP